MTQRVSQVEQWLWILLIAAVAVLLPRAAGAQSTISGSVTDPSGAVLPGVIVEASSPALIEQTRSVVTDDQGRYSIVNVRPGIYTVTFTLAGFTPISRAGLQVAVNTTVPVNAQLQLGWVQETVIVRGSTPMVDVQQAVKQQVLNKADLDALPTSRNFLSSGVVMAGVKISAPDMGGLQLGAGGRLSTRGRSSGDDAVEIDGLDVRIPNNATQSGYNNFGAVQEVTYQTSAIGVESMGGGVRINMIAREGGNVVKGDVFVGGSSWQADNLTQELQAGGLRSADGLEYLIEVTPSIGGPILKDHLWFFASGKFNKLKVHPAGARYFDTGAPGYSIADLHNLSGRLTWQASPKNKFTAFMDRSWKAQYTTVNFTAGSGFEPGVDWGTATSTYGARFAHLSYAKWTSTLSSRWLLESGLAINNFPNEAGTPLSGIIKPYGSPEWYAGALKRDLVLNTFVGQSVASYRDVPSQASLAPSLSLSYVTGTHNAKVGVQYRQAWSVANLVPTNAHLTQQFRNGVPDSVLVYALPGKTDTRYQEFAAYATDSWAIRRLTMNMGLRLDRFAGRLNAVSLPAGRFIGAREFPELNPFNPLLDVSPRMSAVYDLFGNAKTALKFSAGKYVTQLGTTFVLPYAPGSDAADTRLWSDVDLIPGTPTPSGAVLPTNRDGIAQDNEIGPSQNSQFGRAPLLRADDDLQREYGWDYAASVQHEFVPNLSINAGWYANRTYDSQQTVNVQRRLSDFTTFQTPNPYNTTETLTIYRLNAGAVGAVDNVLTNSDINHRDYQAIEASVTSRLLPGGSMNFGWSMERMRTVSCDTPNPNQLRFCDQTGESYLELGQVATIPFLHELKFFMAQTLPYQFQVGLSVLSFPGRPLGVSWPVPATVFPGGRTEVVTLPLVSPGVQYLERWNQLDVSVKRRFTVGRVQVLPALELFNLANSNVVLGQNQSFGQALGNPQNILPGRLTKLTVMAQF